MNDIVQNIKNLINKPGKRDYRLFRLLYGPDTTNMDDYNALVARLEPKDRSKLFFGLLYEPIAA